jgi:protease-4
MSASFVGMLIAGILLAITFVWLLTSSLDQSFQQAMAQLMEEFDQKYEVKEKSVLHLKLSTPLKDHPQKSLDLGLPGMDSESADLVDVMNSIKKAKQDPRIKGIYLDLSYIPSGFASIEEVRNALIDFKTSEKFIVAYSEGFNQSAYYLATVADEIMLYPEGGVTYNGLRSEVMFFKGLLEKLEIEVQVIRGSNNKFKSAVEPFLLDKMSDANRKQKAKYVDAIWNHTRNNIGLARNIDTTKLNDIADSILIRNADDALSYGFVDKLAYKEDLLDNLKERLQLEKKDTIQFLSINNYLNDSWNKVLKLADEIKKDKIAVIYAEGSIVDGSGDKSSIGSRKFAHYIRSAKQDSAVKAIVLRVNSPGGSALASDVIWKEVVEAKKVKPVVVSMGDVAASGGYYISCAADKIFAHPNTITGSIGVFGMIPNTNKFFKNKLGITYDGYNTNTYADFGSMNRALTQEEYDIIQEEVDNIYNTFISKVGDGRNLSVAAVDSIGQGRVWSGTDALDIGLVDELGGLNDAIAEASKMANIDKFKIQAYPEIKDPLEELFSKLFNQNSASLMLQEMGIDQQLYLQLKEAKAMATMSGIQARMPYIIRMY